MPNAPILISGATGYIGRHAIAELATGERRTVAIGRDAARLAALPNSVEKLACEACHSLAPEKLAGFRDGIVFHLAGEARRSQGAGPSAATALVYAQELAEFAARAGVGRVVLASSIYARLHEEGVTSDYGAHKLEVERAFRAHPGFATLTLRLPPIYGGEARGSIDALARLVRRGVPLPLGRAREKRSYLEIGNLCALLRSLASADDGAWKSLAGRIAEASDGPPVSTRELLAVIGGAVGRKPRLLSIPPGPVIAAARLLGRAELVEAAFAPLPARSDDELRRLTGWSPQPLSLATLDYLESSD